MADYTDFRISIVRGDDVELQITVTFNGAPDNITGYEFWLTAKERLADSDADAKIALSSLNGDVTIDNAAGGVATFLVPGAITADLPSTVEELFCDIQVKLQSGRIQTPLRGMLVVEPDVTRRTT